MDEVGSSVVRPFVALPLSFGAFDSEVFERMMVVNAFDSFDLKLRFPKPFLLNSFPLFIRCSSFDLFIKVTGLLFVAADGAVGAVQRLNSFLRFCLAIASVRNSSRLRMTSAEQGSRCTKKMRKP